jgi:biopolymer transport protein ExbD
MHKLRILVMFVIIIGIYGCKKNPEIMIIIPEKPPINSLADEFMIGKYPKLSVDKSGRKFSKGKEIQINDINWTYQGKRLPVIILADKQSALKYIKPILMKLKKQGCEYVLLGVQTTDGINYLHQHLNPKPAKSNVVNIYIKGNEYLVDSKRMNLKQIKSTFQYRNSLFIPFICILDNDSSYESFIDLIYLINVELRSSVEISETPKPSTNPSNPQTPYCNPGTG